jgi:hypothetical protein
MNNQDEEIAMRLWDFIDGLSTAEERAAIVELLHTDPAWKAQYVELLELHQLTQSVELEAPSMRFTQNVMEQIGRETITRSARSYIDRRIVYGIGIFFVSIIALLVVYMLASVNWSVGGGTSSNIKLPDMNLSQYFNSTFVQIFLIVDTFLLLFLIDRWLNKKKEKFQQHHTT